MRVALPAVQISLIRVALPARTNRSWLTVWIAPQSHELLTDSQTIPVGWVLLSNKDNEGVQPSI